MADTLLYIKFKDTASDKNTNSHKIAIDNLIAQLKAAAARITENPEAVYDYVRQDLPVDSVEPVKSVCASVPTTSVISTEEDMINSVFTNLKRTQKSETIVKYFVQNSGIDLTVEQIAFGASLTKSDLSVWLAQTGKKIPAIINTARGVYKFNPNEL